MFKQVFRTVNQEQALSESEIPVRKILDANEVDPIGGELFTTITDIKGNPIKVQILSSLGPATLTEDTLPLTS